MTRAKFKLFSEGHIGGMTLPNRMVRSATWDPAILATRKMVGSVLELYAKLSGGGVGMIITGDFSVIPQGMYDVGVSDKHGYDYSDVRIDGFAQLVEVVRQHSASCKIIAQISGETPGVGPSQDTSPFRTVPLRSLSTREVEAMIDRFADSIEGVMCDGFDGVQLHAAHGGLLSRFLSPYTNRRQDRYGGSAANRVRIISQILERARQRVGTYPILAKVNCTDFLEGGIDAETFPELAARLEDCGLDALEISGGMRECMVRDETELGFKPLPFPESRTRIRRPGNQSYFLEYARAIDLSIPVILSGGNRNVDRLEQIITDGDADFVSMCRPLLCEPNLPLRWREGRGPSDAACIACNSCIFHQRIHLEKGDPKVATCLYREDPTQLKVAQTWLRSWVDRHKVLNQQTVNTDDLHAARQETRNDGDRRQRLL